MKKFLFILVLVIILAGQTFAQVEAGDREVSFLGYYSTFIGEDFDANGSGSLQLSYSKFYTKNLQIGFAPTLRFSTGEYEDRKPKVEIDISASVFMNFNLATASKTIPYFTAQYYQYSFEIDTDNDEKFTDFSYVTVGLGIKNFINEYAAFNTLISYGFSLREEAEGGLLLVMTGLSFIF
ncbi:hypothetical protein KAR48_15950 [bacterium]|nr:hypothetical protein [bacterium]